MTAMTSATPFRFLPGNSTESSVMNDFGFMKRDEAPPRKTSQREKWLTVIPQCVTSINMKQGYKTPHSTAWLTGKKTHRRFIVSSR